MISWLFEIGTLKLSTAAVTYGGNPYAGVVLPGSFSGVTQRWDISGSKLILPNEISFDISNVSGSYTATAVEGEYCTVRLIVDGTQSRAWKFKIIRAVEYYKKITCQCEDFLQEFLDGDYPNTKTPREIWPSSSEEDNTGDYCVPIIFGAAYIPVRPINTGTAVHYVLGESGTYEIEEVRSPRDWPSKSTWLESEYTMNQSTAEGHVLGQPLIHDGAVGVWPYSGKLLDMLCKYTNTATATTTNPADWIEYIVEDYGVASADIDATTFGAAGTLYATENITFEGGIYLKESRGGFLSNLLALCDSYITCSDKVELRQFSATSQEVFTVVMLESFRIGPVPRHAHNTGRVHWAEADGPQDVLTGKTTVTIDDSISAESVSSEILNARFLVGQSQNAQKAARLYFQKRFSQKNRISFTSTFTRLTNTDLVPGMVITVDNPVYGGTYTAILTEMSISHGLEISCEAIVLEYMAAWADILPAVVTPVTDDTDGFSLSDAINESVERTVDPASAIVATSMPYEIHLAFTYTKDAYFEALELWMSDTNSRAAAVHIADVIGDTFVVSNVNIGATKYFWTRIRDSYGNESAWYPVSDAAGVSGSTSSDPAAYLALLSGAITEDELYGDLNARIDLIDTEFTWTNDIFAGDTWAGLTALFPDVMGYSQTIRDDLDNNISVTTALQTNVENNYASIVYVDNVESSIYGAAVSQFSQINAEFVTVDNYLDALNTYKASITQLNSAKSEIYNADVSMFTEITAQFDSVDSELSHKASINQLSNAKIDIYGSSVEDFTYIEAAFDNVNSALSARATITYVDTTFTTESEAGASGLAYVEAELGTGFASVSDLSSAVVSVEDDMTTAKAQRTIKVEANGNVTGLTMIAGGAGADISTFTVEAQTFRVVTSSAPTVKTTPFIVGTVNGTPTVGVNGNLVVDGTVRACALDVDDLFSQTITIKTGGLIKSNNYSAGISGWQIDYLGNAEFNDVTVRGELDGVTVSSADGLIVDAADGVWISEGGSITFESDNAKAFSIDSYYGSYIDSLSIAPHTSNQGYFYIGSGSNPFDRIITAVSDAFMIDIDTETYYFEENSFFANNAPALGKGAAPWGNLYCDNIDADFITASSGINFGIGQSLDYYAEGTYAPTMTSGSGSVSLNSSYNTLAYVIIGRLVTVIGEIRVGSVSSASGTLKISLPVNMGSLSETSEYFSGTVVYDDVDTSQADRGAMFLRGSGTTSVHLCFQHNSDLEALNVAEYMKSGTKLTFQFNYFR